MESAAKHINTKQDKIWSYYQREKPNSFAGAKKRLDFILHEIKRNVTTRPPMILNIGIGDGYLEERALSFGWKVYSIDPDHDTVERMKRIGVHGFTGYIEAMPFEHNMFDAVVASEVLEHLTDQQIQSGVQEIARVLKPGGVFIGTVPYQEELGANLIVCPDCGNVFHRWGHQQSFDNAKLHDIFDGTLKLHVAKAKIFPTFSALNWKGKIVAVIKQLLFLLNVHGSNEHWYFQARKGPAAT